MKVLELFAGSRSIGKAAEELGFEVFSSDINAFDGIDYVVDILDFDLSRLPWKPDIIWASPPCTSYSIAGIRYHRDGQYPKSDFAIKSDKMILKVLNMIQELKPSAYFIENPRGMLRKMHFMQNLHRDTVTYCQYGDFRMKPTDIWHFSPWIPKPMCKNGDPCHEASPRGQTVRKLRAQGVNIKKGGTESLKNDFERSKIPHELCLEVLKSCVSK